MKGSTLIFLEGRDGRGKYLEGTVSGALKPGIVTQIQSATNPVGNRYTYEPYNPSKDGFRRPTIVLLEDWGQGKLPTVAYTNATRGFFYMPLPGDELNMLVDSSNGALGIGDPMMLDAGTGKLLSATAFVADYATLGLDTEAEVIVAINLLKNAPQAHPFTVLETLADPSSDTLTHCMFN